MRTFEPDAPMVMRARERIGFSGPLSGVALAPKKGTRETHPLQGADISRVVNILAQRFRGRSREYQDLLDDMMDRDLRVRGVTSGRILAITGRPYSIKPPLGFDTDADAVHIAEVCSKIVAGIRSGEASKLHGSGWATCLANIASGAPRGESVSEIEWGTSRDGYLVPKALHWRHPNRFGYDDELRLCLDDNSLARTPLEDFGEDKFVVHSPTAGWPAYPTRRGFLLACVLPSLVKRSDIRFWLKATERWGMPLPLIELPEGKEALKDDALDLANNLASNFVGVLWGGVKLSQVPGTGSLNPAVYKDLADFCNTEIAVHVLGNNLNAEIQGGSFAAAKTAAVMRYDILAADIAELDDTITQQLLAPIVRYNWPGAPVPVYVSELRSQEALTIESVNAGLATPDEYRSSLGWEPMEDGKGTAFRAPLVQVPASVGPVEQKPGVQQGAEAGAEKAQDTALNGAQVTAMQGVLTAAAAGEIPRESAIALLTTAFPIDTATAERILGTIGKGFVPAAKEGAPAPAAPPPGGAAPEDPFPGTPENGRSTSQTSELWGSALSRALSKASDASARSRSNGSS